jgi:hypothetical protein
MDKGDIMNYKDVRKKFVELSGRYDLTNADWTDNGADFFINAGQRYLDRQYGTGKAKAKHIQSVSAGTTLIKTTGLRSVLEVYAGDSTDGLYALKKASISYLKDLYGEAFSAIDRGTPEWYTPIILRPFPDTTTSAGVGSWAGYYDTGDVVLDNAHYTYDGIIIVPAPEATIYVSIYGLFFSPTLSAVVVAGEWTQTKSTWTENFPEILLKAALYELEVFYRNTEGAKDWNNALMLDLAGMDKDAAEEESAGIFQIGG